MSYSPGLAPPSSAPLTHPSYWDQALKAFLVHLGLTQALRGFELDMVVMNSDWEHSQVPGAVENLIKDLLVNDRLQLGLRFVLTYFHG